MGFLKIAILFCLVAFATEALSAPIETTAETQDAVVENISAKIKLTKDEWETIRLLREESRKTKQKIIDEKAKIKDDLSLKITEIASPLPLENPPSSQSLSRRTTTTTTDRRHLTKKELEAIHRFREQAGKTTKVETTSISEKNVAPVRLSLPPAPPTLAKTESKTTIVQSSAPSTEKETYVLESQVPTSNTVEMTSRTPGVETVKNDASFKSESSLTEEDWKAVRRFREQSKKTTKVESTSTSKDDSKTETTTTTIESQSPSIKKQSYVLDNDLPSRKAFEISEKSKPLPVVTIRKEVETTGSKATKEELEAKKKLDAELFLQQARNAKYSFDSSVEDGIMGLAQSRTEKRDGLAVTGSYSYSDGFVRRTIHYVADENGYRVTKDETEHLGDGPVFDLDGNVDVATSFGGRKFGYHITSADIASLHDKKMEDSREA